MRSQFLALAVALAALAHAARAENALHFDGSNDRVTVPLPPVFSNPEASDFTIETWLSQPASPSAFGRVVFAQSVSGNVVTVAETANGVVYFYVVSGGITYSAATTESFPAGRWAHLALGWQASTHQLSVFFDGVRKTTSAGGGTSTSTAGTMTIGARNDGAQPLVAGLMDELRIWNLARSTCLIRRDARVQLSPTTPGLVVYYDFNQGVPGADNTGVTALPDLSGGDDNATLVNFALIGASSNWLNSDLLSTTGNRAVNVNRSNLVTSEYGTSDDFNVVLGYPPTQNVVLNLSTDNNAEALVLPATLTFTPGDWNVPQPVVVSGLDDGVGDGDSVYHVIVAIDASSDVDYACESPVQIDAINLSDFAFQDGFE